MMTLPVDVILPDVIDALQQRRNAVLQAPPGAGKTTRVPLALLDAEWLGSQRILMLEPRRLAARAAAGYLARQRGEEAGATVGYRMRMDTRVSRATRLEVVTEGVLTRMLQSDPSLDGVGAVIFDEFHERSLQADVGLALTLQARTLFRPDLAVLVMSATLESEPVSELLGRAPVLTSQGRAFPVDTQYLARPLEGPIEPAVARIALNALAEQEGDLLVFLPGQAEIARVQARLEEAGLPSHVDLFPLFGNLPAAQQDRVIAPSPPGRRKIVLATSIAETSLTIDGVRVVIDGGLMRVPRFSPRTGMSRLETVRVTRSSAEQRRGRAGRTAPGYCYRLWTEAEEATLLERGEPEILQADLAPLALDLAIWGVPDAQELQWLDAPPAAAFAQAQELLVELGALDPAHAPTPHGRQMAELPLHPRLAHMVLRGRDLGLGALAAELAALLGERDILPGTRDPDVGLRLHALHGTGPASVNRDALRRVRAEARQVLQRQGSAASPGRTVDDSDAGLLLALAYPDRVARRRAGRRGGFLLRNGRGAVVEESSALAAAEFIVAAQVDDRGAQTRVFLGAPLREQDLTGHFGDQFTRTRELTVEGDALAVRVRERTRLGALVLAERILPASPEERVQARMATLRRSGLAVLPWTTAAIQLTQRMAFLHEIDPAWPDVADDALLARLDEWLSPALDRDLATLDLSQALRLLLTWSQRAQLEELAPSHLETPAGSRLPIDYSNPRAPLLAVRLQEIFGWQETPRLADGRVPLVLQLLSPARRPVQITSDLAGFWSTGYFEVRKHLRGRYPKHYWPDDPLTASPTRRVRPPN